MLVSLAAACLLSPAPQDCVEDLPLPSVGQVRELGRLVEIDEGIALATDDSSSRLVYVWDRNDQGAWEGPSTLDPGGEISNMKLDGNVLLLSVRIGGENIPRVWRRQADESWLQDPALIPPVAGEGYSNSLGLRGDRVVLRGDNGQLWVYEYNAGSGTWDYDQTLTDAQGSPIFFSFVLQVGDDRIAAQIGSSSNPRVALFELDSAEQWVQTQTLEDDLGFSLLDLDGDRLLVRHGDQPEVWMRNSDETWELEQELTLPFGSEVTRGVLDSRVLVLSIDPGVSFASVAQRVRYYSRRAGSTKWLQQGAVSPAGGVQSIGAGYGFAFALDRGVLIAGEPDFDVTPSQFDNNQGRVAAIDLTCRDSPPVVHWIPGSLRAPGPNLPSDYATALVNTDSPLTLGAPRGLRDPNLNLRADYSLEIIGQPCSFTYSTTVCSFVAYSVRDGVTGTPSDDYPLDPFNGFPQFSDFASGPTFAASSTNTTVQWPFLFEANSSPNFSLEPTGQPMDLQIAAQTYNCFDSGGIWSVGPPETLGGDCGYDTLPTNVQDLDLDLTVSGLLAFDLTELGPQSQSTVCDALPNSTGAGARLTAEGSAILSEDALYLAIDNVPPGELGILVLAAQPATPPYLDLGQGQLCIGAPLLRLDDTLSVAGAYGHISIQLDFDGLPAGTVIDPGSTWYLQYTFRDLNPIATANTSSAIAITFE